MLYLVAAEGHTCFDCSFRWLVDDKGRSLFVKPVIASLKALGGRKRGSKKLSSSPSVKEKKKKKEKHHP